jgi:hypothetical protein
MHCVIARLCSPSKCASIYGHACNVRPALKVLADGILVKVLGIAVRSDWICSSKARTIGAGF